MMTDDHNPDLFGELLEIADRTASKLDRMLADLARIKVRIEALTETQP